MSQRRCEDEIVVRYIELSSSLATTPSVSLTTVEGEYCVHCIRGRKTVIATRAHRVAGRRRWRDVCHLCRRPWEGSPIELPRGDGSQRRIGASEARFIRILDHWSEVRAIVEERPAQISQARWDFCTTAHVAYVEPRLGTYEAVVYHCRSVRPQFEWSVARVRAAIETSRWMIGRRAVSAGLISSEELMRTTEWLTTGEFGEAVGLSSRTIQRRIDDGLITAKQVGRGKRAQYRIHRSELERYLDDSSVESVTCDASDVARGTESVNSDNDDGPIWVSMPAAR